MAVSVENVTPTVAVGIGGAGCEMISTLHELVKEEDIREKFRFVGIDSNEGDLTRNIDNRANQATRFVLDTPKQWKDNSIEYDYLIEELLPGGETQLERSGAQRKRRIGRYYVDCHRNFRPLKTHLSGVIREFANTHDNFIDKEGHSMNIWVVNSLGGGTGSGAFPVVTAMIDEIRSNTAWSPGDFRIMGIGALPNTDRISQNNITYHLNAYAALRDIKVLTNADAEAGRTIRLGEEREAALEGDRLDFNDVLFNKYFLQPFDQNELAGSEAYANQLNKSSASIPLYLSLIEGQEDWPHNINTQVNRNSRIFVFDTYEVSVPVEDIHRYYTTEERISAIIDDIDSLEAEKDRVTNDIAYLKDVSQVDIDSYIEEYCDSRNEDVDEVQVADIVPEAEEVELPSSVPYNMVETGRSAVAGLSPLSLSNVDEAIEERYKSEWDQTKTDDVDHKKVFEYICYQIVARKAKEEKQDHRLHDLIESTWQKYRDELMNSFGFLDTKDAAKKWNDGLRKFLGNKIDEKERNLPRNALYAGGLSFILVVLLMFAWVTNLGAVADLADTSTSVASATVSIVEAVIGLGVLVTIGFVGFYLYRRSVLSSLKETKAECESAYNEYRELDIVASEMHDRIDRLDLGKSHLERRESSLERDIEQKESALDDQRTLQGKVADRLGEFKFEFDRKLPLPIPDADGLQGSNIKNKVREYIHNHRSLDIETVNREVFDMDDMEIDAQESLETRDTATDQQDPPNSIKWFVQRDHIKEEDLSKAMNEILSTENRRLNRNPLEDLTNEDPDVVKILQYVWNPTNQYITEVAGGGSSYDILVGDGRNPNYNTDQPNAKISDEFRVWMTGIYTNFYLVNSIVYHSINDLYEGSANGDKEVTDELGLPYQPNFVTSRFAYPEFYSIDGHPLQEDIEDYS